MLLRALILLLVVMNAGVAAWWWLHVPAPPPALPPPPPGVAQLALLSEADLASTPALDFDPAPVADADAPRCLALGPFQTPTDARRAALVLGPLVARLRQREITGEAVVGYRVYLPAQPSREEALGLARRLQDANLRDYYVVTAGSEENTISLGQFRELGNAEARRDEARAAGFDPMLEPRSEAASQWWLELAAAEDFDWREALGGYAGVGERAIACF